MKYSKEERDRICKEYINSNIKRKDLCEKYDLSFETLKSWLRRYYPGHIRIINPDSKEEVLLENSLYSDMSNKELQIELIKKDIELERLKKNYSVQINNMGKKEYTIFLKKTSK